MITKKGKPISGGAGQFKRKAEILTDQARTSAGAQKVIKRPPEIFAGPRGPANVSAPTSRAYRSDPNFSRDALRYGGRGQNFSVRDRPSVSFGAVGYDKGPYLSRAGINSVNSGFPQTGRQRVIGGGNQQSAKEMGRLRKEYPGIFGAKWRP